MTSLQEIATTLRGRARIVRPDDHAGIDHKAGASVVETAGRLIGVKPFASTVQLEYLTKGWEPLPTKPSVSCPGSP